MTVPVASAPIDLVTTAVLELLKTSGRKVCDGAYDGDPVRPPYPYHLLYTVGGGSSDPTPDLDADPQTITVAYQVSTVSNLRNQCERAAREAHDLILARRPDRTGWAHDLTVPGWEVVDRRPDPATPGTDRTGEVPNAIFTRPARYLLTLSPT